MFCKNCGKEIADDSKFCQYCGTSLETIAHEKEKPIEVELSNKDGEALQVEDGKKKIDNSKNVANEIVWIVKMIGLSICLFAAYMLIFVIVRQKDIKHYDYATNQSYLGESCYDPDFMTGSYALNWEEEYYKSLHRMDYNARHPDIEYYTKCSFGKIPQDKIDYRRYNKGQQEFLNYRGPYSATTASQCLSAARELEKKLKLSDEQISIHEGLAREYANKSIERWNNDINYQRKYGYERELKEHAKYAAIITLIICILGRYLYLLVKWVLRNKS